MRFLAAAALHSTQCCIRHGNVTSAALTAGGAAGVPITV
jgi:hypothetical protein